MRPLAVVLGIALAVAAFLLLRLEHAYIGAHLDFAIAVAEDDGTIRGTFMREMALSHQGQAYERLQRSVTLVNKLLVLFVAAAAIALVQRRKP